MRLILPMLSILLLAPVAVSQDPEKDKQAELKEKAKQMKEEAFKIRGLNYKSDVAVGVYTKDELRKYIVEMAEKESPRPKVKKAEKALAHFGLIPRDLDLYEAEIDLITDGILGFYDPKTKEMRLIDQNTDDPLKALGLDSVEITLVHELTHAAQDQNFDLLTVPTEEEYNDDMVLGVKSLIEGEASIVGWTYGFKENFNLVIGDINKGYKDAALPGKAGKLPVYLRETLAFPYGYGTEFVLAVKKAKGGEWDPISKMYEDLPASSAQVLHPKKYYDQRVNPIDVTLPTIGDGYELLNNNVHGEFVIAILLRELVGGKAAKREELEKVAEGWAGDRWHVVEKGEQVSSVWYTTWTSEEAAKKFFAAYHAALGKKYMKSTEAEATETKLRLEITLNTGKQMAVLMERKGQDVLVIDGDPELLKKAGMIWEKTKKEELKQVVRFKRGSFTCAKHPKVSKDINAYCPECGERLVAKKKVEK